MALAYLQYVKDSSFLLAAAVMAWFVIRRLSAHRDGPTILSILAGCVLLYVLMMGVFWVRHPDPLYYIRETVAYFQSKVPESYPAFGILKILAARCFKKWLLGYGIALLPLLFLVFIRDRRVGHKALLLSVAAVQSVVLWGAMRMTQGQERFMLLIAPPIVAIMALGLARLAELVPLRRVALRPALAAILAAGLSGLALRAENQQYGYDRTNCLKEAWAFVDQHAPPGAAVVAAMDGFASYTMRTLYQFNGFRPLKGGGYDLALIPLIDSGFVILSDLEAKTVGADPECVRGLERVFHAGNRRRWAAVYRIDGTVGIHAAGQAVRYEPGSTQVRIKGPGRIRPPQSERAAPASATADPNAPRQQARDGDCWSVEVESGKGPVWIYLEQPKSASRVWPGVQSGPHAARARLTIRLSSTRKASVQLGAGVRAVSLTDKTSAANYRYGGPVGIGADVRELKFEQPLAEGKLSYVVPVIRVEPVEAGIINISSAQLDIIPENAPRE